MARHQSHLIELANVPCRDDDTPTVRGISNQVDGVLNLVDYSAVVSLPFPPLLTVYRPKVSILVGPFVPDSNLVVLQLADVGVPRDEPQQLVDNTRPVYSLSGHCREALGEVETHLVTKHRDSPRPRTVSLLLAFRENPTQEIQILLHMPTDLYVGSPSRMRLVPSTSI